MSSSRSSFALLVAAGVCWGTGGVTGRALTEVGSVSAPAVAAYRLLLGGGLLVVALLIVGRVPRGTRAWRRVGAIAALAAAFQASYFAAVAVSSVTVATLLTIGSAPILVVVADALAARRLPSWADVRPVATGVVGLGLLVGAPTGQSLGATLAGAALSVLAGAGFALLTLVGRRPVPNLDEATSTGYGFLLGGTALAIVSSTTAGLGVDLSLASIGLLCLLATVPTAVAYLLYFRGLRGSTAATATVVALLEPLTGTVLAVSLLGEQLSVPVVLGAVLLLASVVDSGRTRAGTPRHEALRT
ncbi:DMT family transporter [Cryptosporangium minutisporangium]|uniref:EamA family transporter n=1 Tax=Cryptosporangium minutisporangium TaxID=113569 RepID=A0ABP6T6B3_9ACTN